MPYRETIEELAEALADMLGLYNQRLQKAGLSVQETRALVDQTGDWAFDHADTCQCRRCWCGAIERRMRAAVANETQTRQTPAQGQPTAAD